MKNPNKYLGNELKYLERVLNDEKGWSATGGSWNHTLEQKFADKFGARYAIAMNSGTATLHSALLAAGIGKGDEVIVPALTVIMTATAVIHAGATPVFADIDPNTFNISPISIAENITPKTKAIIPVSLYGLPCDMTAIMKIADQYNLCVIEDNAQAFNPEFGLRGHFASYSFETTKHLSCGEGGMLITNDKGLAERARKFAGHGYKNMVADDGRIRVDQSIFQNPNYKRHDTIGYNYRMPEFNAAIVVAQLERAAELVMLRKKAAYHFNNACSFADYLIPQEVPSGYPHSYYTYGVLYYGKESWQDFRKRYIKNGGDGIYGAWQLPYNEPVFDSALTSMPLATWTVDCPIAEDLQPKLMQFKTNYRDEELGMKKAEALYATIKELERERGIYV